MSNIISNGYTDTFRHFYPEEIKYSWWSYRFNSRAKNVGWRLDYFLSSAIEVDIDAVAFEAFIQEAEKLFIDRQSALKDGISLGPEYSLDKCRKEILCYKQLYKAGKGQNIQPHILFLTLDEGFGAAIVGYQLYKTTDLKIDVMTFAKTAEKFGKILGKDYVSIGNSFSYKQVYQDVIDKEGY